MSSLLGLGTGCTVLYIYGIGVSDYTTFSCYIMRTQIFNIRYTDPYEYDTVANTVLYLPVYCPYTDVMMVLCMCYHRPPRPSGIPSRIRALHLIDACAHPWSFHDSDPTKFTKIIKLK